MIDGTTPNRKEGARMQLGTFRIENPIVLAPMAGVTDWAYRCIAASLGADITVTEMVSSRALVYHDKRACLFSGRPTRVSAARRFSETTRL